MENLISFYESVIDHLIKIPEIKWGSPVTDSKRDRIFLSYASEDLDKILNIYQGLKKRKLNVWLDKENLRPGEWMPQIEKAIARSRYFIICISNAALRKTGDDQPGFMDTELNAGYRIAKRQPATEFTIVPVRLEDCGRGDHRLTVFQQYDLFDDFEAGLDKLAVVLGGVSIADPGARDKRGDIEKKFEGPMGQAEAAYYARDYDKAITILDTILEIKPDYALAWINKSSFLEVSGHYEEALRAAEKAIDQRPDFYITWYNKGVALIRLKRYEEAIPVFEKAIELKPDFAEAWCDNGYALAGLNRHKEVLLTCDKAIQLKPEFSEAWFNKGNSLLELCRYDEALTALDEAIRLKPDFHGAWHNKGASLFSLGRHEEALTAFNKAFELEPKELLALYNKVRVLEELGRHEETAALKKEFLEISKNRRTTKIK